MMGCEQGWNHNKKKLVDSVCVNSLFYVYCEPINKGGRFRNCFRKQHITHHNKPLVVIGEFPSSIMSSPGAVRGVWDAARRTVSVFGFRHFDSPA